MDKDILKATLLSSSYRQVNKKLVKEIWLLETIVLQDLIDKHFYFRDRDMLVVIDWQEFFFNTGENIEKDTNISIYNQRKAFKKLSELGIMSIRKIWVPARNHFSLDFTTVFKILKTSDIKIWKLESKNLKTINNNKYNKNKNNIIINNTKSEDFDLQILEDVIDLWDWEPCTLKVPAKEIKAGRNDINLLLELLKEQANLLGVAYNSDKERAFAKHLLDAKEFWKLAENLNLWRAELALKVMVASQKIWFRKWVCSWPKAIYQNYAEVFNKTKQLNEKSNIWYL